MGNKLKNIHVDKRQDKMDRNGWMSSPLMHYCINKARWYRADEVLTTAAYDNMVKEQRDKIVMPFKSLKCRKQSVKIDENLKQRMTEYTHCLF
ncbi:hypothetical protein ACOSQ4_011429 [Xanthoceras sorbifolium]